MKIVIYFKKLGIFLEKIAYESYFELIYGREKSRAKAGWTWITKRKIRPHKKGIWDKFLKNFWQETGQFSAIWSANVLFWGFRWLAVGEKSQERPRRILAYLSC